LPFAVGIYVPRNKVHKVFFINKDESSYQFMSRVFKELFTATYFGSGIGKTKLVEHFLTEGLGLSRKEILIVNNLDSLRYVDNWTRVIALYNHIKMVIILVYNIS